MSRVITVELGSTVLRDFQTVRALRIIAVQLESPFASPHAPGLISPDKTGEKLKWDSRDKEQERATRVFDILEALSADADERSAPDIVLFPEYSVPESAHSGNYFQEYADKHRCILVPGTCYGQSDPRLARLNVCRIYIPDRAKPITLVKKHPTPAEAQYLADAGPRENILQILLRRENDQLVSLNFFVCRDYLLPYHGGGMGERAKLWQYEGINFVLMHNEEARLFEGHAAPEVRRLRGPGRLVVFVNNANTCAELGTALLGPSPTRERNDVVKSVPWDREGMLIATLRPWNIRHVETRPDKTVEFPILGATVSLLDAPTAGPVVLQPGERIPAYRAVWKPAFLEAIKRVIVIDLRVARRLAGTIRKLSEKNARFYAVAIRGVQDVIIRRYAYRDEQRAGGDIPPLASFFTGLSEGDLHELFEDRNALRIIIHPKDILKYRGVNTTDSDFAEQAKKIEQDLTKLQSRDLPTYMDRLDRVGSFATEVNPEFGVDPDLNEYFYDKCEKHIPIGYEFNNGIRETYILVGLMAHEDRLRREFHNEMIAGALMNDDSVREIFIIRTLLGEGVPFNYLVKTKSKDYDTDRIIRNLRVWREGEDVSVITRTFDVTDYLKNSSVLGVANFDQGLSMSEFADTLSRGDSRHILAEVDFENRVSRTRITQVAGAWSQIKQAALETDSDHQITTINDIYVSICLMNFARPEIKDEYRTRAESALLKLYKCLEDSCIDVVATVTGCDPALDGHELGQAVVTRFPKVLRNENWSKFADHPERVVLAHANELLEEKSSSELRGRLPNARRSLTSAGKFRNSLVHGSRNIVMDSLANLRSDGWESGLEEVNVYVQNVLQVLATLELIKKLLAEDD